MSNDSSYVVGLNSGEPRKLPVIISEPTSYCAGLNTTHTWVYISDKQQECSCCGNKRLSRKIPCVGESQRTEEATL